MTDIEPISDWVLFRSCAEESAALALCGQLKSGNCPAKHEARAIANAIDAEYCVFVPRSLEHRARWVMAQLPVSDTELEFLATGKLPIPPGDTD